MLAHMRDQVGALTEGFQADGALVRLLAWGKQKHKRNVGENQ